MDREKDRWMVSGLKGYGLRVNPEGLTLNPACIHLCVDTHIVIRTPPCLELLVNPPLPLVHRATTASERLRRQSPHLPRAKHSYACARARPNCTRASGLTRAIDGSMDREMDRWIVLRLRVNPGVYTSL